MQPSAISIHRVAQPIWQRGQLTMAAGHDLGIAIHPKTTTRAGLVPILIVSPEGSFFALNGRLEGAISTTISP
jgi:hypothetical protein